jgi:hypothetical protein
MPAVQRNKPPASAAEVKILFDYAQFRQSGLAADQPQLESV